MFQQVVALIIIFYFIFRLIVQKRRNQLSSNEFKFWLFFWVLAIIAISFLKQLDNLVAQMGFSASGIDILLYIGFVILFYLVLKLRLKIEKMDRNITKIVQNIALSDKNIKQ